jgi:hypothetical protein
MMTRKRAFQSAIRESANDRTSHHRHDGHGAGFIAVSMILPIFKLSKFVK